MEVLEELLPESDFFSDFDSDLESDFESDLESDFPSAFAPSPELDSVDREPDDLPFA